MSRKLPGSAIVANSITLSQISGSVNDTSNAAYGQANTARGQANTAYGQANAAYDQANTARGQANTAYAQANSARSDANTTFATINTTFATLNTSAGTQNTTFGTINTNITNVNSNAVNAYAQANAAYGAANTRLLSTGGTLSGDLIITGNLTVSGNQTILNTEVLTTEDAEIILLSNTSGTPALNAGLIVNRGTSTNTFLRWNEAIDEWGWSDSGTTTYYFEDLRQGLGTINTTFGTTNTTFGTVNTTFGTVNTAITNAHNQANTARSDANTTFATVNTTFATINTTFGTSNTSIGNRVLKAGDTMTGQLNISSGGLLVTGNVGIGTTNPSTILTISKAIDSAAYGSGTRAIDFKIYFPGYDVDTVKASIYAGVSSQGTLQTTKGYLAFLTATTTSPASQNLTEKMRIEADGNIGIGTTNPYSKLTVSRNGINEGTVSFDDENNNAHLTLNGADARVRMQLGTYNNGGYGSWIQSSYDNNESGTGTSGTEPLALNPQGGNVGIGTASPSNLLDVWGPDGSGGRIRLVTKTSGSSSFQQIFFVGNTGSTVNDGYLQLHDNGTAKISMAANASRGGDTYFNTGGNFGIGTASPAGKLHVSGGDAVLYSGSGGNSPKLIFGGEYSTTDKSIYLESYFLVFKGHNNEGFKFITVNSSGTQSERLRVGGDGTVRPGADNSQNLGATNFRWANIYTADLNLSNRDSQNDIDGTWGEWTIQEGEEDLFLINRRNGKRYAFVLKEIE